MVEAAGISASFDKMIKSKGCMQSVLEFLKPDEAIALQGLNQRFYDDVIPGANVKVQLPQVQLVLESSRKNIKVGFWKDKVRECSSKTLLKIGTGEGETDPEVLGFNEVYFQYFVPTGSRTFLAWPLENEALLKKGRKLTFDSQYRFVKSEELPELGENTMRPTAVVLNSGRRILMLGGRQDRSSQILEVDQGAWRLTPKLPLGHNITTNISVNWKDKAVFTFIIDAQLTIKSAVLDLETLEEKLTDSGTENTAEMSWALNLANATHKIDRLHLKCGVTMEDGTICVVARGRPEGMRKQISGMALFFTVSKDESSGQYTLTKKEEDLLIFPSVFPRQLDFLQKVGQKLVMVQDTPDEEDFEAYTVDLTRKRQACGESQWHYKHIFQQ